MLSSIKPSFTMFRSAWQAHSTTNVLKTLHKLAHAAVQPTLRGDRICCHIQPFSSLSTISAKNNLSSNVNPVSGLSNTPTQEIRRLMSKFLSKSASKRLPLNTKRAKKGYYKGKGCTSEGRLTSKGKFIADQLKKLQLIVPDLEGFPLKPYVAKTISKYAPEERLSGQRGM